MRHSALKRKLKEAEKQVAQGTGPAWAMPDVKVLSLLLNLVSEDPEKRETCTAVKKKEFFTLHLGRDVDCLMNETGAFTLPPKKD